MGLTCIFAMPLRQLAAGQIQHWMFRRPANLLLEQAVHPLSQMLSLCGPVSSLKALAGEPHKTDSPSPIPRALSVSLEAQNCSAQIHIHFGSSYPVWQIVALCSDGVIKADMVQNRVVCEEQTANLEPLDNVIQTRRLSRGMRTRARSDLVSYGLSLLGVGNRSDTFYRSMVGSVGAFYRYERPWVNTPEGAAAIVQVCEEIASQAFPTSAASPRRSPDSSFKADAVVLGGTGFIGHHVVRALAAAGMKVAAVSRSPIERDTSDNVRFLHGDIRDGKRLAELIGDSPFVINASGPEITENWTDCERNIQAAVGALTEACERTGVRRLVHLSSIAALYLGNKGEIVTGRTAVDPHASQRANYSRGKALEEIALLTKHEETGLPVCILRPAIVVGEGGTPYHTGVGLFANERHCMGWNTGKSSLPFVLAQDVASAALLAVKREGIDGRCYNLAGDVRLSAQEYIEALAQAMGRPLVFHPQSPDTMYLSELMKWVIKRTGGRKVPVPSKRDLLSRTLVATLDCSDAKADLGWEPAANRDYFLAEAIGIHASGFKPTGR
jgi:nucleoside-diphosphate-sugar epimerase